MDKMNPEIKARWIEALLSGEYKQGRGYLQKNGQFCCLGVLCDIAVKDGVIDPPTEFEPLREWDFRDETEENAAMEYGYTICLLPEAVAEWAGLGKHNDSPEINGVPLIELNDERGLSFAEIASLIKENL